MDYKDYLSEEPFLENSQYNLVIVENSDKSKKVLYVNNQLLTSPIIDSQIEEAINNYLASNNESVKASLYKLEKLKEF